MTNLLHKILFMALIFSSIAAKAEWNDEDEVSEKENSSISSREEIGQSSFSSYDSPSSAQDDEEEEDEDDA